MRRIICVFIMICLLLSLVASLGVVAQTESDYNELWQEKRIYEIEKGYIATGAENFIHRYYMDKPETMAIPVILYTEQGRSLKYEFVESYDGGLDMVSDYLSGGYVGCPELIEMRLSCYNAGVYDWVSISTYRKVMRTLGITSDELRKAYQTMKETPEVARDLLPFLSDAQFAQFVEQTKEVEIPENFVIEAACMKDDGLGEALMCVPGSVYVPAWDGSVSMVDLFSINCISNGFSVEAFDSVDMATEEFNCFIEDLKTVFKRRPHLFEDVESPDGRTPLQKLEYLESAREKQLAEKAGREAAFIGELGSMLTAERLFGTAEEAPVVTVAELAVCDLTGEDMGNFLVYLRENIESYESTADPTDGRTPLEKLEYLEAQREAQLKAADTGDGMEKAFLVIGLGALTMIALTVSAKRRKMQ